MATFEYIRIFVNDEDAMRELKRLEDGPEFQHFQVFAAAIQGGLSQALLNVHRDTGSLALSGRHEARIHEHQFQGEIAFGGPAGGGIHDPVDYAQLEQARSSKISGHPSLLRQAGDAPPDERDHNFMRNVAAVTDPEVVESILSFFRGDAL